MKPTKLPVTSLHVQNFKAVRDTGVLRLGGLTAFIGDNGTGKSSVIEALRFAAALSRESLDSALKPFGGYEHLRWKGGEQRGHKPGRTTPEADLVEFYPVQIALRGHVGGVRASATTRLSGQNKNLVVFEREELKIGANPPQERAHGAKFKWRVKRKGGEVVPPKDPALRPDQSILNRTSWFDDWQFLDMAPDRMKLPVRPAESAARVRLEPDASNIAAYLLDLRREPEHGADAFAGLLETLQVILPYVRDLELVLTEMFDRQVALKLHEATAKGGFTVPGWMLSTGTLRLVALLALLRHPKPPSLLCVEEIENGLDPRTIQLVVNELVNAADSGRTQIMVTTHSPYLLDLVPLKSLVLVERKAGSPPTFDQPAHHEEVRGWAESFTPGRLYTMGTFRDRRRGE
jgi:predicted ATPase